MNQYLLLEFSMVNMIMIIFEPHTNVQKGQGLMIYSFRVEALDSKKCRHLR